MLDGIKSRWCMLKVGQAHGGAVWRTRHEGRGTGRDLGWNGMGRIVIVGQAFGDDDRTSKEDVGGWVE